MYRYSQKTGNFYPDEVYYPPDALPDDLIACSDQQYEEAMSKPPGAMLDVIGGKLAIRPPPAGHALDAAKNDALMRIDAYSKSMRMQIAGTSDSAEIAAWNNKLRIAQAIQAGTASDADKAAFQAEVAARGVKSETLDIFVQKVLRNAAFYAQAVALIDGIKRHAQDAINAAKTPDEVAAALASAKTQAESAYARLMASSGG